MRPTLLSGLLALPLALSTTVTEARRGGIAGGGCVGCHDEGAVSILLEPSPATFAPGDQVAMLLSVGASGKNVAGVFVDCEGHGTLQTLSGQGLAEVSGGLVHTAPRPFSGGSATFTFNWIAPSESGAVRCAVYAIAGDGDGRSSGDVASEAAFDFLYGCDPATYYRDLDGDGSGVDDATRTGCSGIAPPGYAPEPGDCNDNSQDIHPSAVEYCNNRDDNCNGEVDEDSVPVQQYPDADGDGYYSNEELLSGDSFVGCLAPGYAAMPGDCRPDDPAINPGAVEICNLYDDDCDGRVDQRVRPQCGEGRCRRDSGTCELETCIPGTAQPETCNLLDDDCDGIVDNGVLCDPGLECIAGQCRVPDVSAETGGSGGTGTTSSNTVAAGGIGGSQVAPSNITTTSSTSTDGTASAAAGGTGAVQASGSDTTSAGATSDGAKPGSEAGCSIGTRRTSNTVALLVGVLFWLACRKRTARRRQRLNPAELIWDQRACSLRRRALAATRHPLHAEALP